MKTYLTVFVGSAVAAVAITPVVVHLARRWGLLDQPGVRKVHHSPIPRIGGVAIVLAFFALLVPVFLLNNTVGHAFRHSQVQIVTLLAGAVFMFAIGLWDDIRSLPARTKLLALIAASLAVCASGSRIESLSVDPLFSLELGWASWPITVLWICVVTVGMNFIDGLDGLAAGIAAIVCGVIAVFASYSGQIVMTVLMLALLGSLTGFLFFNFNPARIFMGDCGSMFLGFLIGAGSVVGQAKTSTLVGIALPAAALGVPILDALFTVIRRGILDRRSIFHAERGHIHHRLMEKGLSHRHAVLAIYALTLGASSLGLLTLVTRQLATLLIFGGVLLLLLLAFHCIGAARLQETIAALKKRSVLAHKVKEEKSDFEDAQLRMREATTFSTWWDALCSLAEKMEFERVALSTHDGESSSQAIVWRRNGHDLAPWEAIQVTIPLGKLLPELFSRIEVAVRVNGSLETFGRRVMLFGRLIDEHGLEKARHLDQVPAVLPLFGEPAKPEAQPELV